ncbi:MAG: hydantoinase/oxoprolinase family protein [Thermoproteota archaeon]|nr:MAG: hydantoinase/oxoprolinase family protein [Candidatus Korarchaeota archaeon]
MFRVGIDVGGTFTDAIVIDEEGKISLFKSPTTPKDISEGVFNCLKKAAEHYNMSLTKFVSKIKIFVHGTTIATNTLLTRRGAKCGLITTKGFRDIIEMMRGHKPDLWNLRVKPPTPLVPRYLRIGVTERVDYKGDIITPLNEDEVRKAIEFFKSENVESIAVCFLFSFLNDKHEKRVKEIIQEEWPEVYVSISSEVLPQIREFERTSATVVNAYLMPVVDRYLRKMEGDLRKSGFQATPLIMQSNGGLMTFEVARRRPIHIIESGPAAGVIGASLIGEIIGIKDLISFDMGGTTAKAGLVRGGMPEVTTEYEVGGEVHTVTLTKKGGYPINIPVIDLAEVGAGGGSIAWIDAGGALKVGPKSAEAYPGPACYGFGGTEPTVTDADLTLGFLNPNYFLGGEMPLYPEKAKEALGKIADRLGMDIIEAAFGVYEVVNVNMADAIRVVTIQKGYDPREFTMIAFGGAGPVHAAALAKELKIPKVIVPKTASAFSALGMVGSNLRHDFSRTFRSILDKVDLDKLNSLFREMEGEGISLLKREGIPEERSFVIRSLDMRYVGQHHELTVEIPTRELSSQDIPQIAELFHQRHEALYAYSDRESPIEILNVRVSVIGIIEKIRLPKYEISSEDPSPALKEYREVLFEEEEGYVRAAIYDGDKLKPGNKIQGPAVIEEATTTIVIPSYASCHIDEYRNAVLSFSW